MKRLRYTTIIKACLFISFILVACTKNEKQSLADPGSDEKTVAKVDNEKGYVPSYKVENKEEMVMIYITNPTCGYCSDPEMIGVVKQIKQGLNKKAHSMGMGFMVIGISNNWKIENGYEHLKKFGDFDEVLIGNNWFGTGGIKYIFNEIPGTPAIPNLVITKRTYAGNMNSDSSFVARGVENETLVKRMFGIDGLKNFLSEGLPLPIDLM